MYSVFMGLGSLVILQNSERSNIMRPWLLVDYDDTLGGVLIDGEVRPNQEAYFIAIKKFNRYMEHLGFDPEVSEQLREKLDRKLVTAFGFKHKEHFAEAMESTYTSLCALTNQRVSVYKAVTVKHIGLEVFKYRYMPLPGALETLHRLQSTYRIAVVTKGAYLEQCLKAKDSGIRHFVDDIFVMSFKNTAEWLELFDHLDIQDSLDTTWAIGNAIKSDINPPVRLGTNGIHIRLEDSWDFEEEPFCVPNEGRKLYQVGNITEILQYLDRS